MDAQRMLHAISEDPTKRQVVHLTQGDFHGLPPFQSTFGLPTFGPDGAVAAVAAVARTLCHSFIDRVDSQAAAWAIPCASCLGVLRRYTTNANLKILDEVREQRLSQRETKLVVQRREDL